jgi:hypothetical protein
LRPSSTTSVFNYPLSSSNADILNYLNSIDTIRDTVLQKQIEEDAIIERITSLIAILPQTATRLEVAEIKKVGLDGKERADKVTVIGGTGRGSGVPGFGASGEGAGSG